jgi:hypothetical protein
MFTYLVYGLKFQSNLEIPALPQFPADADLAFHGEVVTLHYHHSTIADYEPYDCPHRIYADLGDETTTIFDKEVGLFILKNGREVEIWPSEGQNVGQIRLYILGTILMLLLHQRGVLALHGSAVEIGGQVVGVIAPSGTGKSSTAAGLYKRGHRLLSDDCIPIVYENGQYVVYPGYPRLKISEAVTECLQYGEEHISEYHPECQEISFNAAHQFAAGPLPLTRIYVLHSGEALDIQPLSAMEGIFGMMANSLPTMWLQQHSPTQFKRCTEFAQQTEFYKMTRSQDLSTLPDLAAMLEQHMLSSMTPELAMVC